VFSEGLSAGSGRPGSLKERGNHHTSKNRKEARKESLKVEGVLVNRNQEAFITLV